MVRLNDDRPSLVYANKSSSLWKEIYERIENHVRVVQSIKTKLFDSVDFAFEHAEIYDSIVTRDQLETIVHEKQTLEKISTDLKNIESLFGSNDYECGNVLCKSVTDLVREIDDVTNDINSFERRVECQNDISNYEDEMGEFKRKMLISVQRLYKNYCQKETNSEVTESKGNAERNLLKEALVDSLNRDLKGFDLSDVCKRAFNLTTIIVESQLDVSARKK